MSSEKNMNERQIVKELRLKLREYFPSLQSFIDQDIITKSDWRFYGNIQFNLIKNFTLTPEKTIRESKANLNKIVKFYESETRVRKLGLKSDVFIEEHDINIDIMRQRYEFYQSHLNYWKKRKDSSEMYFNYEIYMFLYYRWMSNYELDQENTYKLLLDLMGFCNYYAARYFSLERLSEEREVLLSKMKLSTKVLSVIDKNLNQMDDELLQEASAHLN
tara:strand:- start:267 stop:920 length:654 start_codon:yes stop_codon:yes gene_type:complete